MTKQELSDFYKEIEVKRLEDGIIVVNLWKDKERECYNAISLMFAYEKIIYTGDMGYYIFGRDVGNIFTFYKGDEINPEYWSEKVHCADRPIKEENLDLGELEKAIQELVGNWKVPESKQEELDDDLDFLELDENSVIASRQVYEFLEQWSEYCEPCEDINTLIGAAEKWNCRYLYACEVLQWVSNNLDKWLEERK